MKAHADGVGFLVRTSWKTFAHCAQRLVAIPDIQTFISGDLHLSTAHDIAIITAALLPPNE
jgi:hypothetical protein